MQFCLNKNQCQIKDCTKIHPRQIQCNKIHLPNDPPCQFLHILPQQRMIYPNNLFSQFVPPPQSFVELNSLNLPPPAFYNQMPQRGGGRRHKHQHHHHPHHFHHNKRQFNGIHEKQWNNEKQKEFIDRGGHHHHKYDQNMKSRHGNRGHHHNYAEQRRNNKGYVAQRIRYEQNDAQRQKSSKLYLKKKEQQYKDQELMMNERLIDMGFKNSAINLKILDLLNGDFEKVLQILKKLQNNTTTMNILKDIGFLQIMKEQKIQKIVNKSQKKQKTFQQIIDKVIKKCQVSSNKLIYQLKILRINYPFLLTSLPNDLKKYFHIIFQAQQLLSTSKSLNKNYQNFNHQTKLQALSRLNIFIQRTQIKGSMIYPNWLSILNFQKHIPQLKTQINISLQIKPQKSNIRPVFTPNESISSLKYLEELKDRFLGDQKVERILIISNSDNIVKKSFEICNDKKQIYGINSNMFMRQIKQKLIQKKQGKMILKIKKQ